MSFLQKISVFGALGLGFVFFASAPVAHAAVCSILTDTVVDQDYVVSNSCTSIDIDASVSTTWNGVVDLGGGAVTVKTGNTLTMGSSSEVILGSTDDFVVESGAVVSHGAQDPGGVRITARNISILGNINANGKGCSGSATDVGFGPDPVTGICTAGEAGAGLNASGGAGYGGRGGASYGHGADMSATYGSSTQPGLLGSGGSSGGESGSGGGLIHVVASGTLTVDGTISANGLTSSGGAGSGGSVYLSATTFTGSGAVRANGSNADWCTYGGGGGGGRVAVYYGTLGSFSLANISASGGLGDSCRGGTNGERGTTFIINGLADVPGTDLRVTSGLDLVADLNLHHANITFDSGARIGCGSARSSLELSASGAFTDNGATWSCDALIPSITVSSTGALIFTGTVLSFTNTDVFTLAGSDFTNSDVSLSVPKAGSQTTIAIQNPSLTFTNFTFTGATNASTTSADGGMLFLPNTTALSLVNSDILANVSTTLATLSIDALSSLNANGKGCPGSVSGPGYGPDPVTGICALGMAGAGLEMFGGAGYGGVGGSSGFGSGPSATYGSASLPNAFGSGASRGGSGGGRISLVVTATATIDGTITANSLVNGGSGGAISVEAGTILGDGSVSANGSNAGFCSWIGGGGGGRISLRYRTTGTFNLASATVTAGLGDSCRGGLNGGDGSIYTLLLNQSPDVPASLGPSGLVGGSTTGTANPIFTFTLTDPDLSDQVKYRIQIDDSSDFLSPIVDYTSSLASQGVQDFQVGQATGLGTYSVGSFGQTLSNGSYYWRVKTIDGNAAESSYVAANAGSVAFQADLDPRYLSFASETGSGLESTTATSVRIVLSAPHFETVTVHYAVTAGTAEGSGVDYTLSAGTATIPAGETSTTVPFSVVDDAIDEPDETFTITLSSPVSAIIGSATSTVYTILDNDTGAVVFSASSLSIREGSSASYTVALATAPTTTMDVLLSAGSGVALSTSTISFTALNYSSPVTVTVSAGDDAVYTGDRTISITHTASTTANGYASHVLSSIAVSLLENDAPPASGGGGGGGAIGGGGAGGPILSILQLLLPATLPPVSGAPFAPSELPPAELVLNPSDPARIREVLQIAQDPVREARIAGEVRHDLEGVGVGAAPSEVQSLATFIAYGISPATVKLGEGERRALVRDALETMKTATVSAADLERLTRGQIPQFRNLTEERVLAPRTLKTFRTIYGHAPNFTNASENLAWNTLMYRIRFTRDLRQERQGIQEFRRIFHREPKDAFQWATVRVLGYVQ